MKTFIKRAIDEGWLQPIAHIASSVIVAICGWMLSKSDGIVSVAVLLLALYVVIMSVFEIAMAKTRSEVIEEARDAANAETQEQLDEINGKLSNTGFDLDISSQSIGFLVRRNQKNALRLYGIRDCESIDQVFNRLVNFDRKTEITRSLRSLCHTLLSSSATRGLGTRASIMFRSTYMELTTTEDNHKVLSFFAFFTPDSHVPRSMQEQVTYEKRQGCAGLSWDRQRPVIEDSFADGKEWVNNYAGQGTLYKSMVCVPVSFSDGDSIGEVKGIITVDTNLEGFFGKKDNRTDEERVARWIRPFSDYISLTESVVMALQKAESLSGVDAAQAHSG